jgi:hypothetical protein
VCERKDIRFHFTMEKLHQKRYKGERRENNYGIIIIIIKRSAKADPLK